MQNRKGSNDWHGINKTNPPPLSASMPKDSMPAEHRRKPRQIVKPYERSKPSGPQGKDKPKTSAITRPKHACNNLTLHDWLTVVAYHDAHKPISQIEVVKHFCYRKEGALLFNQSLLSRHLSKKGREEDQARLYANPTALNSKRARIVTRPDVEKALFLWVKHMDIWRRRVSMSLDPCLS